MKRKDSPDRYVGNKKTKRKAKKRTKWGNTLVRVSKKCQRGMQGSTDDRRYGKRAGSRALGKEMRE